ncbi:MAG: HEPN domain-containing protein [Spirochaetia bacterium]|nr:HEPN domain-containing protein [Spirochaetia bacterium]
MPHDIKPGSPEHWLKHAESDLNIACIRDKNILLSQLCFHAQQCVEKSLKALLLKQDIEFPKTHNIAVLIEHLPQNLEKPDFLFNSASLTEFAVESRYPSDAEEISIGEYEESIEIAASVLNWTRMIIRE